jgi:hypothetical protein
MKRRLFSLAFSLAACTTLGPALVRAQSVADLDPHVRVTVTTAPSITLRWNAVAAAQSFTVRRRDVETDGWTQLAMLPASATSYDDRAVERGRTYEYSVQRATVMGMSIAPGVSYVLAGIDVPFRDDPGVVVLIADTNTVVGATMELAQLQADLEADGWDVERVGIPPMTAPPVVRAELQRLAMLHPDRLRAAILLGAVPRAFSGNLRPDGHADHEGAWPADGYYADLDGTWTDTRDYPGTNFNANRAGDGRFDPSVFPSELELAAGRVDAESMPAFTDPPVALVRRFLARDHAYRTGEYAPRPRTWVTDTFGYFAGEAFSRAAWRDGNAIFASDPESGRPFFDALEDPAGGYALAFGCGAGGPTSAAGVGNTMDFARRAPRAVFVGLFGSYFGDWSYANNFLRAPLFGSTGALASIWFARPYAHLHGLGAMRSFGEEFLRTAQGSGYDNGAGRGGVHQGLMGDPTLRLFTTRAPSALTAQGTGEGVSLSWTASPERDLAGYHVFRVRVSERGRVAAERVTAEPVIEPRYTDTTAMMGVEYRYRVVAVAKLTTGSGTFFNHSLGVVATATRPAMAALDAGAADAGASVNDGAILGDSAVADGGARPTMGPGCACVVPAGAPAVPRRGEVLVCAIVLASLSVRCSRSARGRACGPGRS